MKTKKSISLLSVKSGISLGRYLLKHNLKLSWLPGLFSRIVVGHVFATSGWGKLQHLDKVIAYFNRLGIAFPNVQAPFVAGMELVCGLFLMIGLGARLVCFPLIIIMIVALSTAKKDDIHAISDMYTIFEFLYIVIMSWIIVKGPGGISVDWVISQKWNKKSG